MSDGDWDRQAEPNPPDEDVAPESDEEVDWASDEVEEPEDGDKVERTEHDKWRRWAWAALVFSILGVIWGLTLSTILLNRSGDNTAELISLFEESQERRDALARQSAQNQAEKQAALKATQAESQAYRARSQAARASEAESNASARRALAEASLAGARAGQAERAPSPSDAQRSLERTIELQRALDRNADLQRTLERNIDLLRTLERSIDLQRTVDATRDLQERLKEAIDALRQAISDLRPRP